MNEIFFIADTHFGHKRIIEFDLTRAYRQFATIEEHDEELIRRWNTTVKPKDTVWHLGDFCFGKRNLEIAGRLNGNKKLVMGNHDMYASTDYLKYFTRLAGAVELKGMILTHVPVAERELESRWTRNIHGHLHTKKVMHPGFTVPDNRYINVSCEQINLTPVNYDDLPLL
jgi:calcineurin-like phosphoesterase family protein